MCVDCFAQLEPIFFERSADRNSFADLSAQVVKYT